MAYRALQPGSRAIQGKPDIVAEWNSFRFWFASTKNRDLFMQAPETYAPLLGGFCPFALTGNDAKMPQRPLSVKDLKAMGVDPDQWLFMMASCWSSGGPRRCGCSGGTSRRTWRKRRRTGNC